MLHILARRDYRRLFAAQIVSLLGTGLLTVALGLMAWELAGANAGAVLGAALTVKMVAYVGLSPVMTALVARVDRKAVLVAADAVRAVAALALPFVDQVWQIFPLIFVLQAASATFTPTYQAVLPDLLPDEGDYTRALSLSRLAYDLEALASPVLAGLLLSLVPFTGLFAGTALGFVASAALVLAATVPSPHPDRRAGDRFTARLTRGARIYLATPRLRGLLALNAALALTGAVVIVLSVVIVRGAYGGTDRDLALALAAYGLGSMTAALALPGWLDRRPERGVMLLGGGVAGALLAGFGGWVSALGWPGWTAFLAVWCVAGAAASAVMTPSGRLLRRSAGAGDRPAVFAAQFALSHACWLVAYPLAGALGSRPGPAAAMLAMGSAALAAVWLAARLWPAGQARELEHFHDDLPPDHPHLAGAVRHGGRFRHRHAFVIDDEHRVWPTTG